jgi:hypothetical protein
MYNLLGLAKYRDSTSRPTIFWNNNLKGCGWSKFPLKRIGGHVPCKELTDGFAKAVCNKLGKGVTYLIHNHQSPYELPQPKKAKNNNGCNNRFNRRGTRMTTAAQHGQDKESRKNKHSCMISSDASRPQQPREKEHDRKNKYT